MAQNIGGVLVSIAPSGLPQFEQGFRRAGAAVGNFGTAANTNLIRASAGMNAFNARLLLTRTNLSLVASQMAGLVPNNLARIGAFGLAGLFSPGGALIAGITAATALAAHFWATSETGAERSEGALKEHERLIGLIGKQYGTASDKAAKFFNDSKAVLELQLRASALEIGSQLQAGIGDVGSATRPGGFGGGILDIARWLAKNLGGELTGLGSDLAAEFGPFEDAINRLRASAVAGTPDFAGFRDEISKLALAAKDTNPELSKLAADLLKKTDQLRQLQGALAQTGAELAAPGSTINTTAVRANDLERAIARTRERTEEIRRQIDVFGLSTLAQEKSRVALELYAAAERAGLPITEQRRELIERLSDAYGRQAEKLELTSESLKHAEARQLAFAQIGANAFENLIIDGQRFDETLQSILKSLATMALRAALLGDGRAGSGILGVLFSGIGSAFAPGAGQANPWMGRRDGGRVQAFAPGGRVRGPGTGKSDSILAAISNGEFVVNAASTARHLPLLEAINAGGLTRMAMGGLAATGTAPAFRRGALGGGELQVNVDVTEIPGARADVRKNGDGGLDIKIRREVAGMIAENIAGGGVVSRQIETTFGAQRQGR